jgi:hypothetical protein
MMFLCRFEPKEKGKNEKNKKNEETKGELMLREITIF